MAPRWHLAAKLAPTQIDRFRFPPGDSVLNKCPGLVSVTKEVSVMLEETANSDAQIQPCRIARRRHQLLFAQEPTAKMAAPPANSTESLHVAAGRVACGARCAATVGRSAPNW